MALVEDADSFRMNKLPELAADSCFSSITYQTTLESGDDGKYDIKGKLYSKWKGDMKSWILVGNDATAQDEKEKDGFGRRQMVVQTVARTPDSGVGYHVFWR